METLHHLFNDLKKQLLPVCMNAQQASAEASLMLEFVLEIDPQLLYIDPDFKVASERLIQLNAILHDRIQRRIPIQYLMHRAWFFGLPFYVNPHVLIPRPETELLVEAGLDWVRNRPVQKEPFQILDFGTGSGAIAVAMARELGSTAQLSALDLSSDALGIARMNAKNLKAPVQFLPAGDGFEVLAETHQKYDVIISNPPYIALDLESTLEAEVLWHEPRMALFPPSEDSYYFYKQLTEKAPRYLNVESALLVEVGEMQADFVAGLFQNAGFENVTIVPDYAGISRVVKGVTASKKEKTLL